MKIRWLCRMELPVIINYDEQADAGDTETEVVKVGEIDEVDLFGEEGDLVNMQFGNGSVSLSVPRDAFEVLDNG